MSCIFSEHGMEGIENGVMKRMCIFAFYDPEGIVDGYIVVLLRSLRLCTDMITCVVNGKIEKESLDLLNSLCDEVILRKNEGYDATAYKSAVMYYFGEELQRGYWDELILMNNTFFGPFVPWEKIFREMEDTKVDFWGFSKFLEGSAKLQSGDRILAEHIQTYFVVIRSTILTDTCFLEFWKGIDKIRSYEEAIVDFEAKFTNFFRKRNYTYATWLDQRGEGLLRRGEVVYMNRACDLIQYAEFPLIKKKAITHMNKQGLSALKYIAQFKIYDIELIKEHISRVEKYECVPFMFSEMDKFVSEHNRIFIYGHGQMGESVSLYMDLRGWKYEGFIVSKKIEEDDKVFAYRDISLRESDGIILALGKKVLGEVYSMIKKDVSATQLFIPQY